MGTGRDLPFFLWLAPALRGVGSLDWPAGWKPRDLLQGNLDHWKESQRVVEGWLRNEVSVLARASLVGNRHFKVISLEQLWLYLGISWQMQVLVPGTDL